MRRSWLSTLGCIVVLHLSCSRKPPVLPHSPLFSRSILLRYLLCALPTAIVPCLSRAAPPENALPLPAKDEIYSRYPYQRPEDFLRFINDCSDEGDAKSVLQAMDRFAEAYPMYKLSPPKANLLAQTMKSAYPKRVLEIGSFFGYSAIYLAANMPQDCLLCCIEGSAENAAMATQLLMRSFAKDKQILQRVRIVNSLSSKILRNNDASHDLFVGTNVLGTEFRSDAPNQFDFVFMDHDKDCYLPDLITLEEKNLLRNRDCVIVADNVIFPGAPDFLSYVGVDQEYLSSLDFDLKLPATALNSSWQSEVKEFPFERIGFETQFRLKRDGMSISRRLLRQ